MKKIRIIAFMLAAMMLLAAMSGCKRIDEEQDAVAGAPDLLPGGETLQEEESEQEQEQQTFQPKPISAKNLIDGIPVDTGVMVKDPDAAFIAEQMDFSVELLKKVSQKDAGQNVLVSPVSVAMALAMTANGAGGRTAQEMLSLLGGHSIEDLNAYWFAWRTDLSGKEQGTVKIANSIWMRDVTGFKVEESFLQTNVQYYNSEVYSAPFDSATVRDINQWVGEHTDGMIDHLVDDLSEEARMMLINALAFEAEWQVPYQDYQVTADWFTNAAGERQKADFMRSSQGIYLEDDGAIGILRNYKGGKYSFGALMPEDLDAYLADFSGEKLQNVLQNTKDGDVRAYLPKFKVEYSVGMNDLLKELGMTTAFGPGADLTKMGNQDLRIDQVLHKTYIEVDVWGTKAAAVTSMMASGTSAPTVEPKTIRLDRPFIYFIIDNETNLPLFIGTLNTLK